MRISTVILNKFHIHYFDNRVDFDKSGKPEQLLIVASLMLQQ